VGAKLKNIEKDQWVKLAKAKKEADLSIGELALRARVGTATLVALLTNFSSQKEHLRGYGGALTQEEPHKRGAATRRAEALISAAARLAIVFDQQPGDWISDLDIDLDKNRLEEVEKAARQRIEGTGFVRAGASAGAFADRVRIYTFPPFSNPSPRLGRSLFEELATRVVRSINPTAKLEFEVIKQLGDVSETKGPRLRVGVFEVAGRREIAGWEFVNIPGWRVRIGCLARRTYKLTLRDVFRSGNQSEQPSPGSARIRLVVPSNSMAEFFAAGALAVRDHFLVRGPDYYSFLQNKDVALRLTEDSEQQQTVILTDENLALELQAALPKFELWDLARPERLDVHPDTVPTFPLSLAVLAQDAFATGALRHAVNDLFTSQGATTGLVFAAYILDQLDSTPWKRTWIEHLRNVRRDPETRAPYLETRAPYFPSWIRLSEFDYSAQAIRPFAYTLFQEIAEAEFPDLTGNSLRKALEPLLPCSWLEPVGLLEEWIRWRSPKTSGGRS